MEITEKPKRYDVDAYLDRHFALWDNFETSADARTGEYQALRAQAEQLEEAIAAALPEEKKDVLPQLLELLTRMGAIQRRYSFRLGCHLRANDREPEGRLTLYG